MTEPMERLSPREREILALVATGRVNKEIAAELGLSLSTIKGYVESIFGKLGVHSRAAAVSAWFQEQQK